MVFECLLSWPRSRSHKHLKWNQKRYFHNTTFPIIILANVFFLRESNMQWDPCCKLCLERMNDIHSYLFWGWWWAKLLPSLPQLWDSLCIYSLYCFPCFCNKNYAWHIYDTKQTNLGSYLISTHSMGNLELGLKETFLL